MTALTRGQARFGTVALLVSSLLFAAFPLLRTYFPNSLETPEAVAQAVDALTSWRWAASHLVAGAALLLLPFGLLSLANLHAGTRLARRSVVAAWLGIAGVSLLLVVIGAETVGLSAVANAHADGQATDMTALVKLVRTTLEFELLLLGLVLLAASGITMAVVIWKSRLLPRWSGVVLAVGLAAWIPIMPQPVRVVDGLLIGVGGVWVAAACWPLIAGRLPAWADPAASAPAESA